MKKFLIDAFKQAFKAWMISKLEQKLLRHRERRLKEIELARKVTAKLEQMQ